MHPIDPADHLRLLAQERDRRLAQSRLVRIAERRTELARRERRVDDAWRKLVAALDEADGARLALAAVDPS